MNSPKIPTEGQVLADLGDNFVRAAINAVDGARHDLSEFQSFKPEWFPSFTERFTASFLHERIWARLTTDVEGTNGIHITDAEPFREVRSGTQYRIRVKRHRAGDRISNYPTAAAIAFWSNRSVTLDGLESINLALGYYWDRDLRAVEQPVLSYRDGMDNPVWAIQLHRDSDQVAGFSWTPIEPDLPGIDLSTVLEEGKEDSGS